MELKWDAPFLLLLLSLCFLSSSRCFDLDPRDQDSPLRFRSPVADPGLRLATWSGCNCTNWTGVSCGNQTGRVVSMNLANMNFLKTLDLSHNSFGGVVPDDTMELRQLRELVPNGNRELGGVLPSWIGNFSSNLKKLELGSNSFHGEMPDSLFHLKSLKHLDLGDNCLSGNIHEFHQSLEFLNLSLNRLYGTLPCFADLTRSLTVLTLADNSLVGRIPTCIASLQVLAHLNLSFNHLSYGISCWFLAKSHIGCV
ncbi:hypothetical protein F3Y22_tig00111402pilonHSYRG00015 [Hibiscus syriacus]|uniref:Leucine-rich repeat-containing N-terminal plant-type domain-containing protein n=1 Tax=Hibiscus syriacus TaxID=106335 RepID=A0A6A2YL15_HIBSY|nr:hypothetical protein F3Y22_tig00111402pilonHSYRG00015 [Hibiscus syriacus]